MNWAFLNGGVFSANDNGLELETPGQASGQIWVDHHEIYTTTGGFVGRHSGDGSGLTRLHAAQLTGTVPAASLPGLATNVFASGITLYITNGLIMRVTSP